MLFKVKNAAVFFVTAIVILLAGCVNTPATSIIPVEQPSKQPAAVQPQVTDNQSPAQQDTGNGDSDNADSGKKTPEALANRVDVSYFHLNQRCVTCLCFEVHINNVIEKYFGDDIASGKLTYKVLNAQLPENAAIARKYRVVGSQLFINTVINGFDNIEDIQNIWNWNCRNNPDGFELKVKDIIEQSLGGQR